jgi:hypothetical protein
VSVLQSSFGILDAIEIDFAIGISKWALLSSLKKFGIGLFEELA